MFTVVAYYTTVWIAYRFRMEQCDVYHQGCRFYGFWAVSIVFGVGLLSLGRNVLCGKFKHVLWPTKNEEIPICYSGFVDILPQYRVFSHRTNPFWVSLSHNAKVYQYPQHHRNFHLHRIPNCTDKIY